MNRQFDLTVASLVPPRCHTPTAYTTAGQENVAVPIRLCIVYQQYAIAIVTLVFKRKQ